MNTSYSIMKMVIKMKFGLSDEIYIKIKNIANKDLRKIVGFVPQKGILFSGTIESNIKYYYKYKLVFFAHGSAKRAISDFRLTI